MRNIIRQYLVWSIFFFICTLYGAYALYMGGVELFSVLGMSENAPERAVSLIFILHAFSGGAALLTGPLQFNRQLLNKKRSVHFLLGRIYVGSIWIASGAGLWSALFFDVTFVAKVALGLVSILWFASTTIALRRILNRQIGAHREWMIRSFALSFFFVTFSIWVPGLASTSLPEEIGYPLAVFLSWGLNLMVAEWWIHHTRVAKHRRVNLATD